MAMTVTVHVHSDRPVADLHMQLPHAANRLHCLFIFRYAIGKAVEKTLLLQSLHLLLAAIGLYSPQLRPDCRVAYLE